MLPDTRLRSKLSKEQFRRVADARREVYAFVVYTCCGSTRALTSLGRGLRWTGGFVGLGTGAIAGAAGYFFLSASFRHHACGHRLCHVERGVVCMLDDRVVWLGCTEAVVKPAWLAKKHGLLFTLSASIMQ